MRSNHQHAHLDRYESAHTPIHPISIASSPHQQTTDYVRPDPTIPSQLRFVKAQNHHQLTGPRVTEKWMSKEAHEAFKMAADYVTQLVTGEKPVSYEVYAPDKSSSFYQSMGIGVRTYLQADIGATGVE